MSFVLPLQTGPQWWETLENELDIQSFSIKELAEENGMSDLLVRPAEPTIPDVKAFVQHIRHEFSKPLRVKLSGLIVVALMRSTGQVPPVGVVSSTIISFCNLLHN